MNGFIIVDKPQKYTSRDIVNIVSKKLNTRKIGHTGTLDPIATGVLVLCIGGTTNLVEIMTSDEKEYIAEITLGYETDTLDSTGKILNKNYTYKSKEEIINALKKYNTEYMQQVPLYSAVKVNGERLYDYAFNNENPKEIPFRLVNIKKLELISDIEYTKDTIIFKIRCVVSKGTYIRSLIRDIAKELNTIGVMSSLRRTRQGNFKIEDAITISDINNGNIKVHDIMEALTKYKTYEMDENLYFKVKNGSPLENIYIKDDDYVLFTYNKKPIYLYKKSTEDKTIIKPWKIFNYNITR